MTERPILFSGPLVRAILAGTKKRTRRPVKLGDHARAAFASLSGNVATFRDSIPDDPCPLEVKCPYGVSGDQLWVRETHALSIADPENSYPDAKNKYDWDPPIYRADGENQGGGWTDGDGKRIAPPWRPAIHMPRWASRIDLLIRGIRVERLREIAEDEARSEGVPHFKEWLGSISDEQPFIAEPHLRACESPYRFSFAVKWDELYGAKPGRRWLDNPFVWVVDFTRLSPLDSGVAK